MQRPFQKAWKIFWNPEKEIKRISLQTLTANQLMIYIGSLALIPSLFYLLNFALIKQEVHGLGFYRVPTEYAIAAAGAGLIIILGGSYLWSLIINSIAESLTHRSSFIRSLKLIAIILRVIERKRKTYI